MCVCEREREGACVCMRERERKRERERETDRQRETEREREVDFAKLKVKQGFTSIVALPYQLLRFWDTRWLVTLKIHETGPKGPPGLQSPPPRS